jgi:hypothetical protein
VGSAEASKKKKNTGQYKYISISHYIYNKCSVIVDSFVQNTLLFIETGWEWK